nr:hypothetical protein [uncultured Campylobacter sp.]
MIGTDVASSAEGGAGTAARADVASTVFCIDNADEIESVAAVNSGLVFNTSDAAG